MSQTFAEKKSVIDMIRRALKWLNDRIESTKAYQWLDRTLKAARVENVMMLYLREEKGRDGEDPKSG